MSIGQDLTFDHDEYVVALGLRGSYFVISGLDNTRVSAELDSWIEQATGDLTSQPDVLERLMQSQALRGFRDLHTAVGVSNKKHVSSPEGLLSSLQRNRKLPRINPIVDIYNVWSLQTLLAVGAHDVSRIEKGVSLRRLTGTEQFVPLGMTESKPVKPGEYGYVDAANDVICRMETRQVEKTKVTAATQACFFIVQGSALTPKEEITQCCSGLVESLARFCGGGDFRMLGHVDAEAATGHQ